MRFVYLLLSALFVSSAHAQGFDAATANFRLGGLRGGDELNSVRAATEMAWDLGGFDLQLGGSIAQMGDENSEGDARVILSRAITPAFRLGLSASFVPDDEVRPHVGVYGLNLLYTGPSQYFEGEFLIPDHIGTTGMFSFDINGETWLTDNLSITTHLFRRSTDPESPDMYSITIGGTYALNDQFTLIGEGFQTRADNYDFDNNGGRFGIAYQASPILELTAAFMHVIPAEGETSSGLTLTAEINLGGPEQTRHLFRSRPLPDRFGLAAF